MQPLCFLLGLFDRSGDCETAEVQPFTVELRLREEVKVFQASGVDGWTIKRDNRDRVPLRNQGILLRN